MGAGALPPSSSFRAREGECGSRLACPLAPSEAPAGPGHTGGPGPLCQEALLALWPFAASSHRRSLVPSPPSLPTPEAACWSGWGALFPGTRRRVGLVGGGRSTCLSLFCSRPSASVRSVTLNSGHGPRVQDPLLLGKVSVSSSGKRPSSDENKLESPQRVPRASEVSASLTTWAEDTPARPAMWNPLAFPPGRDGTGREGRLAGSAGSPPSVGPIPTAPAGATLLNTK